MPVVKDYLVELQTELLKNCVNGMQHQSIDGRITGLYIYFTIRTIGAALCF